MATYHCYICQRRYIWIAISEVGFLLGVHRFIGSLTQQVDVCGMHRFVSDITVIHTLE